MYASSSGRAASFFSANGAALSQQIADGKINVQSACALSTRYIRFSYIIKCNLNFVDKNVFQIS
jgi:hypothetical protein